MAGDRMALRAAFDRDPERYHRARPNYPSALVDDLVRTAGVTSSSRVLEIGPGTGQLTSALARRGCAIVGVELGPGLAAVARRALSGFPLVEVVTADVERWEPPAERFDLVVAATSFHWLDPTTRVRTVAGMLRSGGLLAVIETAHMAGGSSDFFVECQECYRKWEPDWSPSTLLSAAELIAESGDIFGDSDLLEAISSYSHERDITYSTATYLDTLLTYSGHIALGPRRRAGLLTCLAGLIDGRFGGIITKRYLHRLVIGRLRSP